MKRPSFPIQVLLCFALCLLLYVAGFYGVEHLRSRRGPWRVTFIAEPGRHPALQIQQPALNIQDVTVTFETRVAADTTNATIEFGPGRPVPFKVPFGECVFQDPLFLPGTVTLELLGHRIEMLPRNLTIDGTNHPWTPGLHLALPPKSSEPQESEAAPDLAPQP